MTLAKLKKPKSFGRLLLAGAALAGSAALLGVGGFEKSAAQAADPAGPASATAMLSSGPAVMRRLTPGQYRATIADIFGPDIPIVGRFERGLRHNGLLAIGTSHAGLTSFSLEQYYESAKGISAEVMKPELRDKYVTCKPADEKTFDAKCAQDFINKYGLMLFRRPLAKEETAKYMAAAKSAHAQLGGFYPSLQATLAGLLVAPDFLLRIERPVAVKGKPGVFQLDGYSKATRMSYLLTNSTPDAELLRAAGAGELDTEAGLARQADRLLASPKFERAIREVFSDMLALDLAHEISKDPDIFPAFNSTVLADAPEQTLKTIVDHLITQRKDYRDLFTTRETFVTRNLGPIYRIPVVPRSGWEKVTFPENSGRGGILSHISFLAAQAHSGSSSATLRGKFVRQTFLCQPVPDPPPNVDTALFIGAESTTQTARERLAAHNENPVCAGCHKLTDPIGLSLENFDGVGTFRTRENNVVIDASGTHAGKKFDGPVQLGQALRNDPQVSQCFVQTVLQSAIGHEITEEGLLEQLTQSFEAVKYRVPDLMRAIAVNRGFYLVSAPAPADKAVPTNTASKTLKGDKS